MLEVKCDEVPMTSLQKDMGSLKNEMLRLKRHQEGMTPAPPAKMNMMVPGDDVVDNRRNGLRKEMWANYEEVIKLTDKVENGRFALTPLHRKG